MPKCISRSGTGRLNTLLGLGALEHAARAQVEGRGVGEGEHADRDESGSAVHVDYSFGAAGRRKVRRPLENVLSLRI